MIGYVSPIALSKASCPVSEVSCYKISYLFTMADKRQVDLDLIKSHRITELKVQRVIKMFDELDQGRLLTMESFLTTD